MHIAPLSPKNSFAAQNVRTGHTAFDDILSDPNKLTELVLQMLAISFDPSLGNRGEQWDPVQAVPPKYRAFMTCMETKLNQQDVPFNTIDALVEKLVSIIQNCDPHNHYFL